MDDRKELRRRMRLRKVGSYNISKAIGRGNFATVYLAYHQIAKTKVAVKAIDVTIIEPENLVKIEREIAIMKTLDHPHVVKMYEVMRTERYLYIVTEYCRGGELFDALVERGRITEGDAKRWFHQACTAVLYLHERGIVHRDLKAENILLDRNGDVKLIDFGFANHWDDGRLLNTWCGSPPYAAPELLLGNEYDGTKADVWSLGVLLYILVTGGFPFPGESIDKLKRAVLAGQLRIPFWVSVECSDLLRKMLVVIPENRFPVAKVIQHRWLHGIGSATKQPEKKETTNIALLNDKPQKLNNVIMIFMQQYAKYGEDLISKEVYARNFDGPVFPLYEILADKLKAKGMNTIPITMDLLEQPRRGSRGSILSGKANVEPEPLVEKMISTQDLVVLGLSTDADDDSDDSSTYDDGDGAQQTQQTARQRRRRQLRNAVPYDDLLSASRRYSEQLLPPLVGQFPYNAVLQQAALQQAHLAALAQQAQLFAPFPGFMPGAAPNLPMFDFARMLPVNNYERRASASECFPLNAILSGILHQQMNQQQQQQLLSGGASTAKAATPTIEAIEEEGRRYLAQRGGNKRNTVHAVGGSPLAGGSPSSRHTKSPYQKAPTPNGERRSSWASPTVTAQQHAMLDKMYKRNIYGTGSNTGVNDIVKLQKEFQELGRLTLGIPSCSSAFTPTGLHSPAELVALQQIQACTPMINITDENNRSLGPPPGCSSSSTTFANIQDAFEQAQNDMLYGQRPATVIGFSSTNTNGFGQPGSSNASTPERPIPIRTTDSNTKMFTIAIPPNQVVEHIKTVLADESIPFEESQHTINLDNIIEFSKLTLVGFGVEIGVAAALPDVTKSHVEFLCVGEDQQTSDNLCQALLVHLKTFESA